MIHDFLVHFVKWACTEENSVDSFETVKWMSAWIVENRSLLAMTGYILNISLSENCSLPEVMHLSRASLWNVLSIPIKQQLFLRIHSCKYKYKKYLKWCHSLNFYYLRKIICEDWKLVWSFFNYYYHFSIRKTFIKQGIAGSFGFCSKSERFNVIPKPETN